MKLYRTFILNEPSFFTAWVRKNKMTSSGAFLMRSPILAPFLMAFLSQAFR